MQRMSARDANNGFGRLIDIARAESVAIQKYGRSVVVVLAFEEYQRLSGAADKHLTKASAKRPEKSQ